MGSKHHIARMQGKQLLNHLNRRCQTISRKKQLSKQNKLKTFSEKQNSSQSFLCPKHQNMSLPLLRFNHATTQASPTDCFDPVCCCQVWCQLCSPLHFCKFARPSVCPFGMFIWLTIWLQKFKHCSKLVLLKENCHI